MTKLQLHKEYKVENEQKINYFLVYSEQVLLGVAKNSAIFRKILWSLYVTESRKMVPNHT